MKLKGLTFNGLPYESDPAMIKPTDRRQPVLVRRVRSGVFDTSDEKSMEGYRRVMGEIVRGAFDMIDRERRFVESRCGWLVYLEWAEKSYIMPEGESDHVQQ